MSSKARHLVLFLFVCFVIIISLTPSAAAQSRRSRACSVDTSESVKITICAPRPTEWVRRRFVSGRAGQSETESTRAVVSAHARWQGKAIESMRIYVDHDNASARFLESGHPYISYAVPLSAGQHRILVVAWTHAGDGLVSEERLVTVE